MTELSDQKIATKIFEKMDARRKETGASFFQAWGATDKIAAEKALETLKIGEDFEGQLASDVFRKNVIGELIELVQDDMDVTYIDGQYVMAPFTHVAILQDMELAYVAKATTAADALEIFRNDVDPAITAEGLKFFELTEYEGTVIEESSDFARIIRASDEREISL